jgi:hypothetical protein
MYKSVDLANLRVTKDFGSVILFAIVGNEFKKNKYSKNDF